MLDRHREVPYRLHWLALGLAVFGSGCFGNGPRIDRDVQFTIHQESALTYYETGDLDRAEDQALRGIAIKKKDTPLRLLLGWIQLRRGTTDALFKARGVFESMADEHDPRAELGLGETLERISIVNRETAASLENGERFIAKDKLANRTAELRREARNLLRQATDAYGRVLERQPDDLKALNGMQRAFSLLDENETALEYSMRLIEVANSERDALRKHLSDPGRDLDDSQEQNLRELARSTESLLGETYLFASSINVRLKRYEKALEHLESASKIRPRQADLASRRAQVLYELGRYEQSIEDVMTFVRLSDKPFDHPDIRRAWDLKHRAESQLGPQ